MGNPEVQQILQQNRTLRIYELQPGPDREKCIDGAGECLPRGSAAGIPGLSKSHIQRAISDRNRLSRSIWAAACFGLIVGSR